MLRAAALFVIIVAALAQTTGTATLVGTVTDSTGAVVAGAKVTVVNSATSFTYTGVTTAEGNYYIPYLSPGAYQLTVEAAGFKTYVRSGIPLRTNETPRLDVQLEVQLEVGSVTESIQASRTAAAHTRTWSLTTKTLPIARASTARSTTSSTLITACSAATRTCVPAPGRNGKSSFSGN